MEGVSPLLSVEMSVETVKGSSGNSIWEVVEQTVIWIRLLITPYFIISYGHFVSAPIWPTETD